MFNEVITLVSKTYTLDEYGDTQATRQERDVFARIRSIGMKEKYEALQAGLNPEYTFVLPDYYEYDNETEILYEGNTYRMIRTYRDGKLLEIVVTRDTVEDEDGGTQSD